MCWTVVPEIDQPEEDVAKAITKIKKEWQRTKKDHGKIQELMKKSYGKRRALVLNEVKQIVEILEMFPPLKNLLYVSSGEILFQYIYIICEVQMRKTVPEVLKTSSFTLTAVTFSCGAYIDI